MGFLPTSDHFQPLLNSLLLCKETASPDHTLGRHWAVQGHGSGPSWYNYFLVLLLPGSLTIVLHLPRELCLKLYWKNEL